ncbi:MAG: branched-chain amino acid ABC transporter permease [Geminicoccaceae bacterium]
MPARGFGGHALLVALIVFALAPVVLTALDQAWMIGVLTKVVIYAMAASGLNLVLGYGNMTSFGHAAYLGIGAYVCAILAIHHEERAALFGLVASNEALLSWPAAVLTGGLAALAIGALCLRTRGAYFIMITLAFAQMIYFLMTSLSAYGGDDGHSLWWGRNSLAGQDLNGRMPFYYVCLGLFALVALGLQRLCASPFGRILTATRHNEPRLAALGIAPYPFKLTAFVLSGCICALAGALLVNHTEYVSPSMLHWSRSGELMIMVILGGLGTAVGPLLGASALILLEESLIGYTEHWQLILGVLLLVLVLTSRGGLAGWLQARASA